MGWCAIRISPFLFPEKFARLEPLSFTAFALSETGKKLKIGILSQAYFPVHGGLSEHVWHAADELTKRGHEVRIITAYFDRGDENWNWDGRVYRLGRDITLPANGAFVNVTFATNLRYHLQRIEAKEKFDVVQIHQPLDPIMPLVACKTFTAPTVGSFHTYKQGGSLLTALFRRHLETFIKRLTIRTATSPAAREFISQYFPGDYRIVSDAIAVDRFRPDHPKIEKFNDGKKNILFVGRMDPRKGVSYLLRAWPTIAKQDPDCRLIIVGGGAVGQYYRQRYGQAFADRIHWEGYVSNDVLPRYFASADVFCAPSVRGESFGIVLVEAMASGAPVVASNIAGYNAVVRADRDGLLVAPRKPQALATGILKLLGDQALRDKYHQAGLKRAQDFAWSKVIDDLETVLAEAAAR